MARPKSANPTRQYPVSLYNEQWLWLTLWHSGNESEQVRELITRAMAFWPDGPYSNGAARGAKTKAGGVRELRRTIRELERQVQQLGAVPVTRQETE